MKNSQEKNTTKKTVCQEATAKKAKKAEPEKMPQAAKEFIEAALARCGELGETTAREIADGTLRPWSEVEKKAREQVVGQCAVIDNATVYRWIAEALHIDAVLPPEWIASFVPPCMAAAAANTVLQSNAQKTAIDIDALFD